MHRAKIYTAELDSPRQEFSVRRLGFVVALSVYSGINFSYASTGGAIQLYVHSVVGRIFQTPSRGQKCASTIQSDKTALQQ